MKKVIWFTGLSGSGKSTIALALAENLESQGKSVMVLDADVIRAKQTKHLGFSREDIRENNLFIANLANEESQKAEVVLVPIISPFAEDRLSARSIIGDGFLELFVKTPIEVCVERDVKGLYAKAKDGEITNMIGFSEGSPYEAPSNPDIEVGTDIDVENIVGHIIEKMGFN
jgi:adenylyl-sulfate kinase